MKKSLSLIMFLSIFVFAESVSAKDFQIVRATIQDESRVLNLVLELNDRTSDIEAMRIDEVNNNRLVDTETFPVSGPTEFVLYQESDRDVINLRSDNFASHQGGDVVLDFLYNGITGSRGALNLDLSRNGDTWELRNNGKKVTSLHFVKNKKFFKVIGIKYIQVN